MRLRFHPTYRNIKRLRDIVSFCYRRDADAHSTQGALPRHADNASFEREYFIMLDYFGWPGILRKIFAGLWFGIQILRSGKF